MGKRQDFVAKVMRFASDMAAAYDCPDMTVDKDRRKGAWGEGLTDWLESSVGGDCSTEVTWDGGEVKVCGEGKSWEEERSERRVMFRYRFSDPCVSVFLDHQDTFAEIEFTDWDSDAKAHVGPFRLRETHAWGEDGGLGLLIDLVTAWMAVE